MARDTRERILREAGRLFHERGFDGTSVADVLERAGVNSGSLYHFFPSKEALAGAVIEAYTDRLASAVLDPAEAAAEDCGGRAVAVLELRRRALAGGDGGLDPDPVGLLAAELASRSPEVARLAARHSQRMAGRIRDWLDAAGPRLPAGTDRDGLARFVVTVAEGATLRARAEGSLDGFDVAAAQLRLLFDLLEEAASRGADVAPAAEAVPPVVPRGGGDPAGWRSW